MAETSKRRPRIDAVIRAIKDGSYDDKLDELEKAIDSRNDFRKEEIMKMVKKVYGEDYVVDKPKANFPSTWNQNSGSLNWQPRTTDNLSQFEIQPGQSPHVKDPNAEQVEEEGEILSTGAQIGGLPNQQQFDILDGR